MWHRSRCSPPTRPTSPTISRRRSTSAISWTPSSWTSTGPVQRAPGFSARRVELRRCRLTGAELAEATIADVTFDECRIDLAGLRHATLERVVFRDCLMGECDLYGATLKDVLFERCELREATLSARNTRARRAARLRPDGSPRGRSAARCPDAVERHRRERGPVRPRHRGRDRRLAGRRGPDTPDTIGRWQSRSQSRAPCRTTCAS